jgi:UDP:flavonoid glycosyltransferase YjiC (YdhE family)
VGHQRFAQVDPGAAAMTVRARDPRASRRLRFLFALWESAGATPVVVRLIARLIARGHGVTVLGPTTIEARMRTIGCDFEADTAMSHYDSRTDYPPDEVRWARDNVWLGGAPGQARAVVDQAAETDADVVVCEGPLFAAMAGAEATGLPCAELYTTVYAPPNDTSRAFWDVRLDVLNDARASVGLEPIASVPDQAAALDRVLVLSIKELADDASPLPANGRYVGPPPDVTAPSLELSGAGDIVLISFSTGNMDQAGVLQRVADAAAELPVRAVLTLGPAMHGADLVLAGNVTAYDYLPHRAVLPGASATVTHAGHGTVMASLAHGVPLILMPMGRDQHVVAQRVVARGAGIVVDERAEAPDIAHALERLLGDRTHRDCARELMVAIEQAIHADLAVRELEALGEQRRTASA